MVDFLSLLLRGRCILNVKSLNECCVICVVVSTMNPRRVVQLSASRAIEKPGVVSTPGAACSMVRDIPAQGNTFNVMWRRGACARRVYLGGINSR
jgi:hypothetical protein